MSDPLADARRKIADERAAFLRDAKSVLADVSKFVDDTAPAIGEVSRHQAMDAMIRYFLSRAAEAVDR